MMSEGFGFVLISQRGLTSTRSMIQKERTVRNNSSTRVVSRTWCNYLTNPRKWPCRYMILASICVVKFVMNFVYETPSGLEETIIQILKIDSTRYTLLFSVYSWPNVVACLISGIIIDRYLGVRIGILVFLVVATVGQIITVFGCSFHIYWLILLGRFVLGIGDEASLLATYALAALWFKGKELSFVFAVQAAFNRLGGACGLLLNRPLYELLDNIENKSFRLGIVFLLGVGLCIFSLIMSILSAILDKRAEKILNRRKGTEEPFSWKHFKSFGINFWLLTLSMTCFYGIFFPFVAVGQVYYLSKFGLTVSLANVANMLTYLVTITAPLLGLIVDWSGFLIYWGLSGFVLSIGAHLLLVVTLGSSFIPFVVTSMNGMSYSIIDTAIKPTIAMLVDDHQLSTAYGILSSCCNIAYAMVDLISGLIIDRNGYFVLEVFLIIILSFGAVFLLLVLFCTHGTKTNKINTFDRGCKGKIRSYKTYTIQRSDDNKDTDSSLDEQDPLLPVST